MIAFILSRVIRSVLRVAVSSGVLRLRMVRVSVGLAVVFMSCMTGLFFRRLIRSVVTYLRLLMPMALILTIAYRCLARRFRFLLIIGSFSSRIRALSCSC